MSTVMTFLWPNGAHTERAAWGAEAGPEHRVALGHDAGCLERPIAHVLRCFFLRGADVLQQERHPLERAVGHWTGCFVGRLVVAGHDHSVQLCVHGLDALDDGLHVIGRDAAVELEGDFGKKRISFTVGTGKALVELSAFDGIISLRQE